MNKLAFVFPGQGTQYPGMGKALYEASPAARRVYALADTMRPGTSAQCFSGTSEELQDTSNTQPCLYTTETAIAATLTEQGVRAHMAAGYSLGELAALTYGGAFPFERAFPLVCHRGQIMARAAAAKPGRMAAVRGLSNPDIEALCRRIGNVYQVNFDCPGQSTVAGDAAAVEVFVAQAEKAGGEAHMLAVSGAFHSPYMDDAAAAVEPLVRAAGMAVPTVPIYGNVSAEPYGAGGDMVSMLVRQISGPVLWQNIIQAMAVAGADTFVEVGPGQLLCGYIRATLPHARVFRCDDPQSLCRVADTLRGT